jgi:hypothetical protein
MQIDEDRRRRLLAGADKYGDAVAAAAATAPPLASYAVHLLRAAGLFDRKGLDTDQPKDNPVITSL